MDKPTKAKIALVAAAASLFTTAFHGAAQAFFEFHYPIGHIIGYILGRLIGDSPVALVCYGITFYWLKAGGMQDEAKP